MSHIFAIGDIHGCFDKLKNLMDKINWDPAEDTLVFMGDYIDRGPESYQVIEYLLGLKKQSENLVFLMGNHEQLFQEYLAGKSKQLFLFNGGLNTLASYPEHGRNIPDAHIEFLSSLLLYYETEEYIFVHAGLREGIPLHQQSIKDLIWIREEFILSDYDYGKKVVFGHTPFDKPLVQDNKIGIDTGAVYGGMLTCLELPEVNFYSV